MKLIRHPQEVKGPTPETKAKAREWPIGMLAKRKDRSGKPFLASEHVMAAEWIEDAFRGLTGPLETKLMKYQERGWDIRGPERVETMSDRIDWLIDLYNNWIDELTARRMGLVSGIMEDVFFGYHLGQIEHRRAIEKGQAKYKIKSGLQLYAEMQGWLKKDA